jgi:hypothetical protein
VKLWSDLIGAIWAYVLCCENMEYSCETAAADINILMILFIFAMKMKAKNERKIVI